MGNKVNMALAVKPIYSENDLLQNFPEHNEFLEKAKEQTLLQIWNERNNFVCPGIEKDESIALLFRITSTDNVMEMDAQKVIYDFFANEFKKENVLSVKTWTDNIFHCFVLVYPLKGRVLKGSLWLSEEKNAATNNFTNSFYETIQNQLDISISNLSKEIPEETKTNQNENIKNLPQVNLISQMNILDEDISPSKELIYDAEGTIYQQQTEMSKEEIKEIFKTVLHYFTIGTERMMFKQAQAGGKTVEEFMTTVDEYLKKYHPKMAESDADLLKQQMLSAVFGNYVLDPLINDPNISDIKIIAPDKIRVKVNGKRMTSNMHFIDRADYIRFIEGIALRNHFDLRQGAIHVFTDRYSNPQYTMRCNVTTSYINSVPYPYLHIRKVRKDKMGINELIDKGMITREVADFLIYKAKTAKGMVFTGKGASGKTTLLNALIDEGIPFDKSGLIIQESEELFTYMHPDIMLQRVVTSPDGRGYSYSLQDEARNGLLTDLDYFIIGEIKGGEALYFLNAAATNHKCWCTVHSSSARDAIGKLADFVMYESKYDKVQAMYMLKELEIIIFMDSFKVTEISVIKGWDDNKKDLIYETVFKL